MKVLIVGAGGQGGPCASILSKDKSIEEIRLVDLDLEMAEKVAAKIGDNRIRAFKVNATSVEEVAKAAENVDVVMDFVMPWMAAFVMEGALKAGAHYVNTAFVDPFWEEIVAGKPLFMAKEFKAAGLTALQGCGMAPGYINILTKHYCNKLDEVKSIKIRLGKKKLGGGPYDDILKPWNPGWSPVQALEDCATDAYCFRDGKYEKLGIYSEIENFSFPEPMGDLLVSHHSHEEPYTIPMNIGKGIEYCDFKYYIDRQPAALVMLGLASTEEIDVKGVKIKPMDLMASILPKAGNGFLNENPEMFEYLDKNVLVSMIILIEGKKDGKKVEYDIHCPKMTAPAKGIYDLFGTSLVNVALPAVIGAKQIVEGAEKGVIFAEQLDPERYFELMNATGYPYKYSVVTR
jgi:saccharopine dehydrogenase (NAD+, L-lysine-forming)